MIGGSPAPYRIKRTMLFIDGSNLLIQMSKAFNLNFRAECPPDLAITLASSVLNAQLYLGPPRFERVRAFWFASYKGDDELQARYARTLRRAGFEPRLFKRHGNREKGVDIDLTREMLVNAFADNYDLAVLVAGDADYVPLVAEVKRYGGQIHGGFFRDGYSEELQLALDFYREFEADLAKPEIEELVASLRGQI